MTQGVSAVRKISGVKLEFPYFRSVKTLEWKHIRNTVVLTVLVWPFVAYLVAGALILIRTAVSVITNPSPGHFRGDYFFSALIFALSVGGTAFLSGKLFAKRQGVLHGLWSAGIALPTAGLLTFSVLFALFPPPPADWQLIRRFERNEAAFNELRDAVQGTGGLESISVSRVDPADFEAVGLSSVQLEAYRAELKRLKLVWVGEGYETGSVYLLADFRGSEVNKGYVYRPTSPDPGQVVAKIVADDVKGSGTYYRPVQGGWYLYAKAVSD